MCLWVSSLAVASLLSKLVLLHRNAYVLDTEDRNFMCFVSFYGFPKREAILFLLGHLCTF